MRDKIDDIQVLRGVAILMVLIDHLQLFDGFIRHIPIHFGDIGTVLSHSRMADIPAIQHVTNPFHAGVELFFVISGFVVMRSLRRSRLDPVAFMCRRFFRLYPALGLYLVLGSITTLLALYAAPPTLKAPPSYAAPPHELLKEVAAALTGTFINLSQSKSFSFRILWSLSVEFQFYICISLFLLVAARLNFRHSIRLGGLLMGSLAVLILAVTQRVLKQSGFYADGLPYISAWNFDFIAAGAVLAFLPDNIFHQTRRVLSHAQALPLFIPLVFLALAQEDALGVPLNSAYHDGLAFLITLAGFVTVVACAAGDGLPGKRSGIYRLLWIVGERSYTIYLIHSACMVLAWVILANLKPALTTKAVPYAFGELVITLLLLIPLSETIYTRVEQPIIKWYAARRGLAGSH